MSCLETERKPLVPLKTLQILFRHRYMENTQYYFTNRKHASTPEKKKQKPANCYFLPKSQKLLSYIKYSDHKEKLNVRVRLSEPLHKKDNLKIAATRDISQRLFIDEPTDDVRAVVEIHPEFYTVIEGRPMRSLDDIKVYTNNIRKCAMDRQQIGYRRDLILKVDQNMFEESSEYDSICQELKRHIENFQDFLTQDYKKACAKVTEAGKVHGDLCTKNSEYLGYVSQLTTMNNIVFKLDAIRNVLKIYRTFLLYVAPISWRQKNDEALKGKSIQFKEGEFATDNDLVDTLDIDKTIENARIELINPLPANMYFTNPMEIMYIYRSMEVQSREYLLEHSKTDAPRSMLVDRIKKLKQITEYEFSYFQYYIDNLQIEIDREKCNEKYLRRKFFRILDETFYDSIASPETLMLKICVEYVYEEVVGKCEEGHQTIIDPMKVLEVMYEDYNLRLDILDFHVVKQAQSDFFSQDLKMMRNAYKAERELRAFREMTNAMNKAFWPPLQFKQPEVKKFMDKKTLNKLRLAEKRRSLFESGKRIKVVKKYKLSREEQDGLLLFTNWCEGQNPAQFLQEYNTYAKPIFEVTPCNSNTFMPK